jgi:hypothetical protein
MITRKDAAGKSALWVAATGNAAAAGNPSQVSVSDL